MTSPIPMPRLILDGLGRVRVKLKHGVGGPGDPCGPHSHHFSASGARVDHNGRPVEARSRSSFRPVKWDLDDGPPASVPSGPPDVAKALALAGRSTWFHEIHTKVSTQGWVLEVSQASTPDGCLRGPDTIQVPASPRGAFVARLVLGVAHAHALAQPLPRTDPFGSGFARENALFLMRAFGLATLHQARIRDEILLGGGPDIGGPGLRGLQQEAYEIYRRQGLPVDEVAEALAFAIDGPLGASFRPGEGPRVVDNLSAAFVTRKTGMARPLPADLHSALDALAESSLVDALSVEKLFAVKLVPRPNVVANSFLKVEEALPDRGPFARIELRTPAPRTNLAPWLVLVPRDGIPQSDIVTDFGSGLPHHVGLFEGAHATAIHKCGARQLFVTYDTTADRLVSSFAVSGASPADLSFGSKRA